MTDVDKNRALRYHFELLNVLWDVSVHHDFLHSLSYLEITKPITGVSSSFKCIGTTAFTTNLSKVAGSDGREFCRMQESRRVIDRT